MALITTKGLPKSAARAKQRAVAGGKLRQIYPGIFTDDLESTPEAFVRRELPALCSVLVENGVISHRSAIELRPTADGDFFLTAPSLREIQLPGVRLRVAPGNGPLPDDIRIPTSLGPIHRSSDARAMLENLQASRARGRERRTWGQAGVEKWLDRQLAIQGSEHVNALRDSARRIAPALGLDLEQKRLDSLIGGMLGTKGGSLKSAPARARAIGAPYDAERIELFNELLAHVRQHPVGIDREANGGDPRLQAFVESYFSNYIEGTEFELDEARGIVLDGRPLQYRDDDSHDIIGGFEAVLESRKTPGFPETGEDFVSAVREWNRVSIYARKAKRPGEFKDKPNRVGAYEFVLPEMVRGTLLKAHEAIMAAGDAAARAVLTLFVVTEVHPFLDGNGRTARLAMNAALTASGLTRIIIPTAYRDDYTLALRTLSSSREPTPYAHMLTRAAAFSRWLDFRSELKCFAQLRASNALLDPREGVLRFPVD